MPALHLAAPRLDSNNNKSSSSSSSCSSHDSVVPVAEFGSLPRLSRAFSSAASPNNSFTRGGDSEGELPVLVVGSACVDCFIDVPRLPARGETLASQNPRTGTLLPGGKGANQAAAAANFGAHTHFAGRFGDDADADEIETALRSFGVDLSLSVRDATCPSGKAFIFLEPSGHNSIVIVQGANVEGWGSSASDFLSDPLQEHIRNAGAVMLQREIPDFVNVAVARVASEAGVPVLLDVGGKDTALDPELAPFVTICWPNETELANITGGMPTETDDQISAAVAVLRDQVTKVIAGMAAELLSGG